MRRSQLDTSRADDPIWALVGVVAEERFSGEIVVGDVERVRLFAADGSVYYAERTTDLPLEQRLVNCGAVTPEQLELGGVWIGEHRSLARLFQRQPLLDRDEIELTVSLATEALLEAVAARPVGTVEVHPLRHHPAGIHHWSRGAAPAPGAVAPVSVTAAAAEPPAPAEPPLLEAAPVVADPEVVAELAPITEPATLDEPPTLDEPAALDEPPALDEPALLEHAPAAPEPVLPTLSRLDRLTPPEPAPVAPAPVAPAPTGQAPDGSVDPGPVVAESLERLPSLASLPTLIGGPEAPPPPVAEAPAVVDAATDTSVDLPPLAPLSLGAFAAPATSADVETLTPLSAFTTLSPGTPPATTGRDLGALDPTPAGGVDSSDIWRVVDQLLEQRPDERD